MRNFLSFGLLVNLVCYPVFAQSDDRLLQTMAAYGIEGAIIMVVEGDQIRVLEGVGVTAEGQAFDVEAAYNLGWAVEPMISLLVMQQAERRALAPDSPLSQVLPEFELPDRPNATAATTVARLMTHVAGLGSSEAAPLEAIPADAVFEPEFFAGARYSYCSRCIGLQVDLLESLTAMPLADLLQREVFYPLHMDETTIQAGYLFSTPADLAKWMSIHLQKGRWEGVQLVKPETVALSHRALQATGRTPREFAGYGWVVTIENGLQVVDETEDRLITARDVGNYQAQMTLIPAYELGFLILTDQPTQGLDPLMDVLLAEFADFTPPEFPRPTRPDLLAGSYAAEETADVLNVVWLEGERFEVQYGGETYPATWAEERVLALAGRETFLYFPEVGRSRSLIWVQDWRTRLFNRLE